MINKTSNSLFSNLLLAGLFTFGSACGSGKTTSSLSAGTLAQGGSDVAAVITLTFPQEPPLGCTLEITGIGVNLGGTFELDYTLEVDVSSDYVGPSLRIANPMYITSKGVPCGNGICYKTDNFTLIKGSNKIKMLAVDC